MFSTSSVSMSMTGNEDETEAAEGMNEDDSGSEKSCELGASDVGASGNSVGMSSMLDANFVDGQPHGRSMSVEIKAAFT